MGVFADHAQGKAERRLVKHIADHRHEDEGEQGEHRLFAEDGNAEKIHGRESLDGRRRADLGEGNPVAVIAEGCGQQSYAKAGDVLRERQEHSQPGVEQTEDTAAQCSNGHPLPQRKAGINRQPAGEGTGHHDAFDTQVEHTGPFAKQGTERAQDERRGNAQDGDPEGLVAQNVVKIAHFRRILYCVKSVATSTESSEAATMTSAM